jgi:O-antigen/teichoic acid export membrane protein
LRADRSALASNAAHRGGSSVVKTPHAQAPAARAPPAAPEAGALPQAKHLTGAGREAPVSPRRDMSNSRASFFRQSAWLAFATVVGGGFMTAVHSVAGTMETAQYEVFATMLRVFLLLGIPSAGLQTTFAQQAAAALTPEDQRQLATTTRRVLGGILLIWLVMLGAAFFGRETINARLKLGDGLVLWPTLGVGLLWLVLPMFRGLLQGVQDFSTLGWVAILDGFLRLSLMVVVVLVLHGTATGAITAAFLAMLASIGIAVWKTRSVWRGPGAPFVWQRWLARVLPFTLGAGAMQVMANLDLVYLKAIIPADRADEFLFGAHYVPAAMIGFALVQFTVPLAMVMFSKIARSAAGGGQTDALGLALLGTVVLGAAAAGFVTVFPKFPLQILYFRNAANWGAAPIVPWIAWAMLAFALANVLVSNLLARGRFEIVPWCVGVALAFVSTLWGSKTHLLGLEPFAAFRFVAQIIGGFNLGLLAIASAVTWGRRKAN